MCPVCHQSRLPPGALLLPLSTQAQPLAPPAPPRSRPHCGGPPAAWLRSTRPATRRRSLPHRPGRGARACPTSRHCLASPDWSSLPTPLPRHQRPPAPRPWESRAPARWPLRARRWVTLRLRKHMAGPYRDRGQYQSLGTDPACPHPLTLRAPTQQGMAALATRCPPPPK